MSSRDLKNTRVIVGPSRNGYGLFAARSYAPGQIIMKVIGRVVRFEILWERRGSFAANCLRFGPNTYLDPGDGLGRYLNHSCEPNAGVRKTNGQLFVFADALIRAGTEIVIDYSTTLGDDDIWRMACDCGRPACRKIIRRFGSLPKTLKTRYVDRGLVMKCILETL